MPHPSSPRWSPFARTNCLLALAAVQTMLIAGCSRGGDATQSVASVPTRSGDVWMLDSTSDRGTAPAALLAFVNGVHVMVVDGDEAYAGTTKLQLTSAESGARTMQLADGRSAQLVPAGDDFDLRFSSGEHALLRKQGASPEKSQ